VSDIVPIQRPTGLATLERGKLFLAQARDLLTVLDFRNKSAAVEHYLKQRDDSDEATRDAAELRLRAERRLGELLAETVNHAGSRGVGDTVSPTIPDGISKKQSSRYQQAATVPEQVFEEHLTAARKSDDRRKLTSASIMRLAKQQTARTWEAAEAEAVAALPDLPDGCRVETARMEDFLPTLTAVDAVITDPPYGEEYIPLYGTLARLAKEALAADGILAVLCGQYHLPRILSEMVAHLPYRWMVSYLCPGGRSCQIWSQKINTFWKPVLLFGAAPAWSVDVVRSDTNDNGGKRFHKWGQGLGGMAALVRALTKPGQLVCDPFLGGGSVGIAALTQGRKFAGCDLDPNHIKTARRRLRRALKENTSACGPQA
jgi:site-specific DNA-methyltransferase (adenine-specific)